MFLLNYVEHLKLLKLPTLKYRQICENVTQVFKTVYGIYDLSCTINLTFSESLPLSLTTGGNSLKLLQHTHTHTNVLRPSWIMSGTTQLS